jgi:hypothetical protein
MKVGDLVKLKALPGPRNTGSTGVVIKLFKKKCWRTQELGPLIDWRKIDPEPHAEVMINNDLMNFPIADLELV